MYVFVPLTLEKVMFWSLTFKKYIIDLLTLDKVMFCVLTLKSAFIVP